MTFLTHRKMTERVTVEAPQASFSLAALSDWAVATDPSVLNSLGSHVRSALLPSLNVDVGRVEGVEDGRVASLLVLALLALLLGLVLLLGLLLISGCGPP